MARPPLSARPPSSSAYSQTPRIRRDRLSPARNRARKPARKRLRAHLMFDRTHPGFVDFICESNRIEGILRDLKEDEIAAHERLLKLVQLHPTTVGDFQAVIAPGKPIRERPGMTVQSGQPHCPRRRPWHHTPTSGAS